MDRHVSPSILAANFGNLEKEVEIINSSKASWLHCDVMDGVYVPNISFGIPVIKRLSEISEKPLDVHLMIVEPRRYIKNFLEAGASNLTIHYEACRHLHRGIQDIKELGMTAGVSINPSTPVNVLTEVIADIDIVLIMSVNPGFGGQELIENTYQKVAEAKELIKKNNSNALIQVDGGVLPSNARRLFDSGVDILVAGTTIFKSDDPSGMVGTLLSV